jgi:hypothetical protein
MNSFVYPVITAVRTAHPLLLHHLPILLQHVDLLSWRPSAELLDRLMAQDLEDLPHLGQHRC